MKRPSEPEGKEGLFVGSDSATRRLRLPKLGIAGLTGRAMREVVPDVAEQHRVARLESAVVIRRKLPRDLCTARQRLGWRIQVRYRSSFVVCHMPFPIKGIYDE